MTKKQLPIRLSETLHRSLKAAAAKSGKSLNGEIVARLERTLAEDSWQAGYRAGLTIRASTAA